LTRGESDIVGCRPFSKCEGAPGGLDIIQIGWYRSIHEFYGRDVFQRTTEPPAKVIGIVVGVDITITTIHGNCNTAFFSLLCRDEDALTRCHSSHFYLVRNGYKNARTITKRTKMSNQRTIFLYFTGSSSYFFRYSGGLKGMESQPSIVGPRRSLQS